MVNILQDIRHSLRQLMRRPIFTATAVLTLAIGMGVNAVAFGVVNGLLFKGYALSGIPGIGRIMTTPGGDESGYASIPEYERFSDATTDVLDIAAEGRSSLAWKHDGATDTAWVLYISRRYFSLIEPPVIAGRLQVQREGGTTSVVIGERFWREKLDSRSLAGLTLRLNDTDVAVAGVIAESFTGPAGIYSPDVWLPLEDLALFGAQPLMRQRDTRWLFVMGRVRDGATPAQVHGLVQTTAAQMVRDFPETHKDRGANFRMFDGDNSEVRGVTYGAAIGMGIIGLVLLLACFNVANLLLARAVERERDMGIRAALGARPVRLMRLVVTEGFLIAIMSGGLALVMAWWTQSLFIGALILIAGVLPGLWPAITAARIDVLRVLGSQGAHNVGARPSRMRQWLVGAQIAGSTMFLAVAGLFMQSYSVLTTFDVGFARDRLVLADFSPASNGYDIDRSRQYVEQLAARVRALPGVENVAIVNRAPFFIGFDERTTVWPPNTACNGTNDCKAYPTYGVSPGYFGTMGIGMFEGREFGPDATAEVVINGSMARALWPGGAALGQTLRIGQDGERVTVIGVTGPTRTRGLDREVPVLFVPLGTADYARPLTLVARTAGPPAALVRSIEDAAHAVDPNVSMFAVKTMEQRMGVQLWPFRTLTWLFSICGSLALILATVGLAGVVIHAVSRRVREFGVRLSIGATPRDLMRDVLASSTRMLIPGVTIGLLLAAGVGQLVRFMFIGVNVLNPTTYLIVAVIQVVIVVIACIGPAIRASRVDPLTALRSE
jgi:predicted permease